jgi:hypothetical protein
MNYQQCVYESPAGVYELPSGGFIRGRMMLSTLCVFLVEARWLNIGARGVPVVKDYGGIWYAKV